MEWKRELIVTIKKDSRRHGRISYLGPLSVSWETSGGEVKYTNGKCIDFSEGGLRIEVTEPIPVRTYITLRAQRINLNGAATVRNVDRAGAKYILGVELSQSLHERAMEHLRDKVPAEVSS